MAKGKSGRPIIVRRIKKMAAPHHGGGWKVAYADFVTALMALFMTLWILGMDQAARKQVASYFQHPNAKSAPRAGMGNRLIGIGPVEQGSATRSIAPIANDGHHRDSLRLVAIAQILQVRLQGMQTPGGQVTVTLVPEGLRVELADSSSRGGFFTRGSDTPLPVTRQVLAAIGREVAPLAQTVVVEGHTDSAPYLDARSDNWTLSFQRANAARLMLEAAGVARARIRGVRGLADTELRRPDRPLDPANRRVSLVFPMRPPAAPGT